MSKKALFWLFLILGILWISGVMYCYLTEILKYCYIDVFPEYFKK